MELLQLNCHSPQLYLLPPRTKPVPQSTEAVTSKPASAEANAVDQSMGTELPRYPKPSTTDMEEHLIHFLA